MKIDFVEWSKNNKNIVKELAQNNSEGIFISYLDFSITSRCTLKCRECLSLMQYYEHPTNYNIDKMYFALDFLKNNVDIIEELRILGGEPFVNPEVYKICSKALDNDHIRNVVFFTNATVLPSAEKMSEWDTKRVKFYISDYRIKHQNIKQFIELIDSLGFDYYVQHFQNWIKHSDIQYVDMPEEERNRLYKMCPGRTCPVIIEDRFYVCEYVANVCELKAVPLNTDNYYDMHKNRNKGKNEFKKYIERRTAPEACKYCSRMITSDNPTFVEPAVQLSMPLKYNHYC